MRIRKSGVGEIFAPWPFIWFGIIAIGGCAIACPTLGGVDGVMIAFDIASLCFALLCVALFRHEARQMRESAKKNDANRGVLLLIAFVVTCVVLVAVGRELSQQGRPKTADVILIVTTLTLCWLFSTLVYCLHYAHLFYRQNKDGVDVGGASFPATEEPNYWDFLYFSSCLAMTFQTSDVDITSRKLRRIVMFHSFGAFVFNLGVIAFSINILGGS
ncbi:Uncharacterized membrane protein [Terriglobus roseus]|uniref:Uncharacterized membrane protein n=2 Tax=Terriglobus roseus TaxID=392734 RepID=A0A1G7HJ02_9BACT|nr:Uncharacterized membrane protein [Terriglobus roseus]